MPNLFGMETHLTPKDHESLARMRTISTGLGLLVLTLLIPYALGLVGVALLSFKAHPVVAPILSCIGVGIAVLIYALQAHIQWAARLAWALTGLSVLVSYWVITGFGHESTSTEGVPFILLFVLIFTLLLSTTVGSHDVSKIRKGSRRTLAWCCAVLLAVVILVVSYLPLWWAIGYSPLDNGDELPGSASLVGASVLGLFAAVATTRTVLTLFQDQSPGK